MSSFRLGPFRAVFATHPELVRDVLVAQRENFPRLPRQLETIRKMDGESLFTKSGDRWARERRVIQGAWHSANHELVFSEICDALSAASEARSAGDVIELEDETLSWAIVVAGRTLLGCDLGGRAPELRRVVKHRADVLVTELGAPISLPDSLPLPHKRHKAAVQRAMDALLYPLIRERRGGEPGHATDIVTVLLGHATALGMTDREIRDHANMLFQAGVDDISSVLVWMFYLVARDASVQRKLREELGRVVGVEPLAYQHYAELSYAQAVAKEALRLFPSTWLFGARVALDATTLSSGHRIEKGDWILLSPFVTHRDPRFFEHPERFDPERFSQNSSGSAVRGAWFPFGQGPRCCAGVQVSMMILVAALALVARRFALEPQFAEVKPVAKTTVRPAVPMRVTLKTP